MLWEGERWPGCGARCRPHAPAPGAPGTAAPASAAGLGLCNYRGRELVREPCGEARGSNYWLLVSGPRSEALRRRRCCGGWSAGLRARLPGEAGGWLGTDEGVRALAPATRPEQGLLLLLPTWPREGRRAGGTRVEEATSLRLRHSSHLEGFLSGWSSVGGGGAGVCGVCAVPGVRGGTGNTMIWSRYGELPSRRSAARPLLFGGISAQCGSPPCSADTPKGLRGHRVWVNHTGICRVLGLSMVRELPGVLVAEGAVQTRRRGRHLQKSCLQACVHGREVAWRPEEHLSGPTGRSDLETSPFCMWAELKLQGFCQVLEIWLE